MRLGVISDIHGVAPALRAVLDDGDRVGVDRWWVLGDLVLFGPHPVEVLEMLDGLADKAFIAGNTDRYVLTDDQPRPHTTPEEAIGDVDLVRRYGPGSGSSLDGLGCVNGSKCLVGVPLGLAR